MVRHRVLVALLGFSLVTAAGAAHASGTYPGRAIQPPSSSIDSDKYHLGKQIFTGRLPLAGGDAALGSTQSARLQQLHDRLPRHAQPAVPLPELAGKLQPNQLEALEYFLAVRYKVRVGD